MRLPTSRNSVAVIAVAVLVGLAVWGLVRLLGVEPMVGKGSDPDAVGPLDVIAAAAVAGIAAWGVRAWLSRLHRGAWWPFIGSTALAISIIGPTWLADGASAVALIAMHVAVGFVLIMGFSRYPASARERATEDRSLRV